MRLSIVLLFSVLFTYVVTGCDSSEDKVNDCVNRRVPMVVDAFLTDVNSVNTLTSIPIQELELGISSGLKRIREVVKVICNAEYSYEE